MEAIEKSNLSTYSHYDFHKKLLSMKEVFLRVDINISSVVEFQTWWVLKARFLAKNPTYKEILL